VKEPLWRRRLPLPRRRRRRPQSGRAHDVLLRLHRQHPRDGDEAGGTGFAVSLAFADKDGNPFDGAKTYKLNVPANAPAKDFWSVVVYDPQTRSELQTSQPFPSKNNKRDKLIANADGSVDLYFGPKAPAGKEANWIASVPSKGWFAIFRLYGPLEPWFNKTWRPGEIEEVK
jgi:hypothetical protein